MTYQFTPEVYQDNLRRHLLLAERARVEGDQDTLKREMRGVRDAATILAEMARNGIRPHVE